MRWALSGVMLAGLIAVPTGACAQALAPEAAPAAVQDEAPATMVKDVLTVDLASALKLAQTRNIDIAQAGQRIRANREIFTPASARPCRRSDWV
jgi:hypothetical protein